MLAKTSVCNYNYCSFQSNDLLLMVRNAFPNSFTFSFFLLSSSCLSFNGTFSTKIITKKARFHCLCIDKYSSTAYNCSMTKHFRIQKFKRLKPLALLHIVYLQHKVQLWSSPWHMLFWENDRYNFKIWQLPWLIYSIY